MLRPHALFAGFFAFTLALTGCIGDDEILVDPATDDAPPTGQGNVSLEWSVYVGDIPMSCIDAGADTVEIVAVSSEREEAQSMACLDGLGETSALGAGDYDFSVRLVDRDGLMLDELSLGVLSIRDGLTTPLGAIEFVVDDTRNRRVVRDQRD